MITMPVLKPNCPYFGSGPTTKPSHWHVEHLQTALVGRSHRSLEGKAKLYELIQRSRQILKIPDDYRLGIIPGSATGAVECALWSLLGPRGIDVISFDVFGKLWGMDIIEQLKLGDVQSLTANFGEIPDLKAHHPERDLVFTWNGTTSGACIPNADWISENRSGLTICDATSAAFCFDLPWSKLDVTAYSWQKGLGGEAAHGVLILSPRAVERLVTYQPYWPIPRLFRLTKNGQLMEGIFKGETINTPSMLCVEDYLGILGWSQAIGGLKTLIQRCQNNYTLLKEWVEKTDWVQFMTLKDEIRSPVSVCLTVPLLKDLPPAQQWDFLRSMANLLRQEKAALDIVNHMHAPPSLRIWCGPTVEENDLKLALPWFEWAYHHTKKHFF